jgi:SAM-dependent methyltransferase
MEVSNPSKAGAAIYIPPILRIYDLFVYGFSSPFAWRCPEKEFIDLYNNNISKRHLDIGCGTGYLLDRCRIPSPSPEVTLVDLNPNSLKWTSRRIERYHPMSHIADILHPLPFDERFDSVGMNYVLHCVPGNMAVKAVAFDHLKARLNPGGVLFGSTIPFTGVRHNALARLIMALFNGMGAFNNTADSLDDLSDALHRRFSDVRIWTVGSVALFVARDLV